MSKEIQLTNQEITIENIFDGFEETFSDLKETERINTNSVLNSSGILFLIRCYFRGNPNIKTPEFIFTKLNIGIFQRFLNYVVVCQKRMTKFIDDYKRQNVDTDEIKFISPSNKKDGCDIHATINALMLCRYRNNFTIKPLSEEEMTANNKLLDETQRKLTEIYNAYHRFKTDKAYRRDIEFFDELKTSLINVISDLYNNFSIYKLWPLGERVQMSGRSPHHRLP